MMESRHFQVGQGLSLVASCVGDPEGIPVLLLHGGGQTRHSWKGALTRLASAGYQGIALDLRGHGDSDWSPNGDYRLDVFVDDLQKVLRELPQPPVLVGASLGGLTSLLALGEAGVAARALVLVDVVPRIEPAGAAEIRAFMTAHPEGFTSVEDAADAVAAYLPHRPRPQDLSGLSRNLRRGEDGRYRWHYDPAITNSENRPSQFGALRLETAAQQVGVPALLIRGGLSRVVSEEGAQELLTLIPHARFVNVEGADHMVAGDRNDAFTDALLAFLDDELR